MTASGRRSEANDVSLLWRHSSWSSSWQLERAYRRCLGNWTPKCCRPPCGPPKALPFVTTRFEPSCVKFHARVTSVGDSGKRNKKERPYISRISQGAPLRPIGTNFELRLRLVDVINCAKFYRNRLGGFGFCEGSKFDHSHWIAMSPLTLCELLFTLWWYAAV